MTDDEWLSQAVRDGRISELMMSEVQRRLEDGAAEIEQLRAIVEPPEPPARKPLEWHCNNGVWIAEGIARSTIYTQSDNRFLAGHGHECEILPKLEEAMTWCQAREDLLVAEQEGKSDG